MHRAMIIGATLFAFAGCSTVAGFGQDVAAAGNALTSASKEAAGPAPKKQTAARKTTPTKVAARSTSAKSTAAKPAAARKTTPTKVAAKSPARKTTKKTVVEPAKVDVVETGKPFKPGK